MLWRVLSLVIAHVLISAAASTQDTPTQTSGASSSLSSTGKSNDLPGKSVVVNWKLTCQQLCGYGYGGPTCGFACPQQQNATYKSEKINLDSKAQIAICPKLCANGLGAKRCHCESMIPSSVVHDHDGICMAFCISAKIQLDGCSSCTGEHFVAANDSSGIQTTTPNWDELCTLWCKMGEGGTLCNCDLPPFV